jgi:hypothetical protein
MDIENLSKEELIRLVKSQKANSQNSQKTEICKFKPLKQNLPPCTEPSVNLWGFCKKHSKTMQALHAEKEYEERKKIEEQKKRDEENAREIEKLKLEEKKKVQPPPTPVKPPTKVTTKKIIIKPNKYGRYEEPESHILFNFETKCAYGVQGPNGKVTSLTPKHVAICEKNRWKYNKIVKDDEEDEESDEIEDEDEESEELEEDEEEIEDEESEEDDDDEDDDEDESEYSDSD